MAISAIPTGMPAFVSGLLSMGAKQLADAQGGGQEPHRRGDARRHQRDQHRQDRHADDERDDGVDDLRGRRLVQRRGRGLPQDRGDHRRRRPAGAGLHPARPGAGARQRCHRGRRRRGGRRPDRGRAGRAGGEAGRRRRGDAPRLPAHRRGAVRLRLQVHGDVPPRHAGRRRARDRAGQGRARTSCWHAAPSPAARSAARRQPIEQTRAGIEAANARMGEQGLRVLAFAARLVGDDELPAMADDPMSLTAGAVVRRHGRHHRSAARRGQGRRCRPRSAPASTCA